MDLDKFDLEKEAPVLFAHGKENPFSVPDAYFNNLRENIVARVYIENLVQKDGFITPDGYFEELTDNITAAISLEKYKEKSETGFSVPLQYFEQLEEKIKDRTVNTQPGKKSSVRKLRLWISYAAAASVTLFAAVSLYLNVRTNNIEYHLNQIPDQDIINYLQMHADEGDTFTIIENLPEAGVEGIDQVSDQELIEAIGEI